jgi:hypothetical protein
MKGKQSMRLLGMLKIGRSCGEEALVIGGSSAAVDIGALAGVKKGTLMGRPPEHCGTGL